jgi:chemosensory pili system protein ChpA (sensor histidine kinase/response regulator)
MSLDSETKNALAEELEDVAMELANINLPLLSATDFSDKEKKEFNQSIQAETERLNDIAELYGYEELTPIALWVHNNVLAFAADPKQLAQCHETGLFYVWIELLAALLQGEGEDADLSSELEMTLLDSHWHTLVNKQVLQQLLTSLSSLSFITENAEGGDSIEEEIVEQLLITVAEEQPVASSVQVSSYRLAPDDDVHPELLEAFFLETPDQVIEVAELIRTISIGNSDQNTHQSAARIAHTIKGSSAVVGLDAVANFAHKLEDILEYSVEHHLPPEVADLLVESSDCLESMFDSLLTQSQPPQQYPQLLEQLTQWDKQFSSGFIYTPPATADTKKETKKPVTVTKEAVEIIKNNDYELAWAKDVHPELLDVYMGETPEHVIEISQLLREIGKQGETKHSETCKKAARLAHTIKGTSAVVGINAVANFGEPLEEILDYAVEHKLPSCLSMLLKESADLLESLYDSLLSEGIPPKEYPELYKKLSNWQQCLSTDLADKKTLVDVLDKGHNKLVKTVEIKNDKPKKVAIVDDTKTGLDTSDSDTLPFFEGILPIPSPLVETSLESTPAIKRANLNETTLRVPVSVIDRLLSFSSELITANTQMADQITALLRERQSINDRNERIRSMLDELEWAVNQQTTIGAKQSSSKVPQSSQTTPNHLKPEAPLMDSLEMDSYNELHSITGLLSESVEDDRKVSLSFTRQLNKLHAQVHSQKQIHNALNSTVLTMRMESVSILAPRLQRIVRETCRQTGKKAELEIIGDDLSLDTDVIKGLIDPLLHLLRNAVDHGIEAADIRRKKTKNETGKIQLTFIQQGDQVVLTLKDDGMGIDADKIYQAALKKGLVNKDKKLSNEEKLRLILLSGFSTRDKVTQTSGRGVGMDVVNTAVKNLSGNISIRGDKDKGSEIQIQVPLTLSAANILLVEVLGNTLAIPNISIQQIYYLTPNSVEQKEGKLFVDYQKQSIPLLPLSTLLSWSSSRFITDKSQSVLIVEHQSQHYALYIDQILNPLHITIKTLKPWMTNVTGVNGVCLLPNGIVAPVLNLFDLMRTAITTALNSPINITDSATININQNKILVVDDSLSNRTALRLMIEALGHEVCTAVDGVDALQQIEKSLFKLIITDLEMPNMNGLEMVESLRTWAGTKELPIIMVTSRSTAKHRKLADQSGVDEYLTKPVDNNTLRAVIDKYKTSEQLDKVKQL